MRPQPESQRPRIRANRARSFAGSRRILRSHLHRTAHEQGLACARECDVEDARALLILCPLVSSENSENHVDAGRALPSSEGGVLSARASESPSACNLSRSRCPSPWRGKLRNNDDREFEPFGRVNAHDPHCVRFVVDQRCWSFRIPQPLLGIQVPSEARRSGSDSTLELSRLPSELQNVCKRISAGVSCRESLRSQPASSTASSSTSARGMHPNPVSSALHDPDQSLGRLAVLVRQRSSVARAATSRATGGHVPPNPDARSPTRRLRSARSRMPETRRARPRPRH